MIPILLESIPQELARSLTILMARCASCNGFYDKSSNPVPRKRLSDLGSFYFKGLEIVASAREYDDG
jgi:hypothetical protein